MRDHRKRTVRRPLTTTQCLKQTYTKVRTFKPSERYAIVMENPKRSQEVAASASGSGAEPVEPQRFQNQVCTPRPVRLFLAFVDIKLKVALYVVYGVYTATELLF